MQCKRHVMFQPRREQRACGDIAGIETDDIGAAHDRIEHLYDDESVIFRAVQTAGNEQRFAGIEAGPAGP